MRRRHLLASGEGRWARWKRRRCRWPTLILGVDRLPYDAEWLSRAAHLHHATRDVEADRSGRRVAGERDGTVRIRRLDVAVTVAPVTEADAAAEAGDVLELVTVL